MEQNETMKITSISRIYKIIGHNCSLPLIAILKVFI